VTGDVGGGGANVTKLTVVGIALLFGILIGLTHEPDSGTAASVGAPDIAGEIVGANHAKPLPRLVSVSDLLALWRLLTPTLLALALLFRPAWVRVVRAEPDDDRRRSLRWSQACGRRGPPAFA
jgi:hypothetical protein